MALALPARGPAGPPSLQQCCLRVAGEMVWKGADDRELLWQGLDEEHAQQQQSLQAAVQRLPPEVVQQILLLLASWQLLSDAAVALLDSACDDGSSLLAGAAAVSLAHCALLSSRSAARLFRCPLPQLRTLSLRAAVQLGDADVALVLQQCRGLQQLDLSKLPGLTAATVAAVAASAAAPQLQALSLASWQVDALPSLAARCTALTSLELKGCWRLQDAAVREVMGSRLCAEQTCCRPRMPAHSGARCHPAAPCRASPCRCWRRCPNCKS